MAKLQVGGAVSDFTVDKETTEEHPSQRAILLRWLGANTDTLRNTNFKELSEKPFNIGLTQKQIYQTLHALKRRNLIVTKDKGANRKPKTYCLNYWHTEMPGDVFNEASIDDRKRAAEIVDRPLPVEEPPAPVEREIPEPLGDEPQAESSTDITIPLNRDTLQNGFSLTLNINFNFQ